MGRRSSGLRNRNRQGVGPYASKGKGRTRDSYGAYDRGRCVKPDTIAGRIMEAVNQDDLKGV